MITDRDLVLASAATYTSPTPTFSGLDSAARVFRTVIGDTAIYAIEGTDNPVGWLMDFMALPVEAHATVDHPDIGCVHGGIFAVLLSVWPQMLASIQDDIKSEMKIAITGHSLGGGCAVLAVGLLVSIGIFPIQSSFFAPPRVGFKTLHELVDKVSTSAYRNGNDPVPEVLIRAIPVWLYEQRPLLCGGISVRPPWDAHHIPLYVALEETLNATPVGLGPGSAGG